MSEQIAQPATRALGAERAVGLLGRHWPWLVALAVALLVPWLSYDWSTGRHSGFMVSMLSQMGIMIIFALSYNMQMGQTGLLSFGHAVFLGLGGYVTAHTLNAVKAGSLWLPLELTPLAGGLGGLAFAILFGYFATKQRATAFAMITLGIGELVTSCALMFQTFFGGEGGVSTNRMIGRSLFGVGYAQPLQVYYLIVAWTVVAVALMLLADPHPARAHGQRVPRQLRARPVRGLRPAHGALRPVLPLRLLRGHRGRALHPHLRDRHLRHGGRRPCPPTRCS